MGLPRNGVSPPLGEMWEAAMVVKLCSRILAAALAVGFVFCTSTQSESNCTVPPEIDFDEPVSYPTCPLPRSITTGDFNGDGALDFAVACGANVITAYRNLGRGSFAEPLFLQVPGYGTESVTAADFDG